MTDISISRMPSSSAQLDPPTIQLFRAFTHRLIGGLLMGPADSEICPRERAEGLKETIWEPTDAGTFSYAMPDPTLHEVISHLACLPKTDRKADRSNLGVG